VGAAAILGTTGFVLMLLSEPGTLTKGGFKLLFPSGCLALTGATILMFIASRFRGVPDVILLALGAVSLLAEIYCLFFAIPFGESYVSGDPGRKVCDRGAYALCRHPGVIFLFFAYVFWGLAALPDPRFLILGAAFSVLDGLYALFQDRMSFPKIFSDYAAYRRRVPFLIPTKASFHAALRTAPSARKKEIK
jgi:protein-S-isoprenylcysteine O-methyltransferase Ste14